MRLIRYQETPPSLRFDIPPYLDGSASHRRVLAKMRGGPKSIDLDYNQYRGGLGHSNAYAYPLDEFCYAPSGEVALVSDGVKQVMGPGSFMWRPAGAKTEQILFMTDCVSICAFGPAREDDWGYRLPPEDVDRWDLTSGPRPRVQFFHYSQIDPVDLPGAPDDGRVVHRPVVTAEGNGSHFMSMAHTTLRKGTVLQPQVLPENTVIYLESGRLQIVRDSTAFEISPREFLYYDNSENPDTIIAIEDSVYITWSAPIQAE